MLWPDSYRYLTRLNAPASGAERLRVEKALAIARLVLAALATIAVLIDATEPRTYSRLVYALLIVWSVYSAGILVWLGRAHLTPNASRWIHWIDVAWPLLITVFTHGPSSPFFPLFAFAQIGAAFRWGFHEAITTSLIGVIMLSSEAMMLKATTKPFHQLLVGEFELNRLIMRSSYLMAIGYLVGTLGENEKERRAESIVTTRVLRAARAENGMNASLDALFRELLNIFASERPYAVTQDLNTDRVYLWHGAPMNTPELEPYVIESSESRPLLMRDAPRTFFMKRDASGRVRRMWREGTSILEDTVQEMPHIPGHTGRIESLLCSSAELGHEWSIRILLVNSRLGTYVAQELRFLELLVAQTTSAIYSVYLVRRLRSRVGVTERARVARELHDGAIQSLISAEMRMDVLRRKAEREGLAMKEELSEVQELLRHEVLNLRELMQQMRPVDLGPQQVVDFLADAVDRFRRDTGLEARFVSSVNEDILLTPNTCRELLRILQEALANVRKHAVARSVLVTFGVQGNRYRLVVSDDGKGFDFQGTFKFDELLRSTKGPTVLKERVHVIGGELTIASEPEHGSRLEILVPKKGYVFHGE